MTLKGNGRASESRTVNRFDGGASWIAFPDEEMQRASHALVTETGVFVVDPVDTTELDDLLAELGEVAGVVVLLDRHTRDAAAVARRHDVSVYLPSELRGVAGELDAPIETFSGTLPGTDFQTVPVVDTPVWHEVALWNASEKTLVVPESVGTSEYFLAPDERLGVHPARRVLPPRSALGDLDPERVLVGHGEGVMSGGASALADALSGSRRRAPALYARTARLYLPI
ncbi:hypothetical protein [Natronorarus salvus]|uniref:hypothetical protein n=1 Tax=Natronorarus salvus TaxID=3117733 RepID=UPI002F269A65